MNSLDRDALSVPREHGFIEGSPRSLPVPPPEKAAPWVEVLGEELAIKVFLGQGGTTINLAYDSRSSRLLELVGKEKADLLGRTLSAGEIRVPLAKTWIAQTLARHGWSVADTARLLHVDERTVQRALKATPGGRRRAPPRRLKPKDTRQIEMF